MNFKIRQTLVRTLEVNGLITGFEGILSCNWNSDSAVFKPQVQIHVYFVLSPVKILSNGAKMSCGKYHFVELESGWKELY